MNSKESGLIFGLLGLLTGVILAFAACSPAQDLTCPAAITSYSSR